MRLLLVNADGADATRGGTEKHIRRLGERLPQRGFEVWILAAFPSSIAAPGRSLILHKADWRRSRIRRVANHLGDATSLPWRRYHRILDELRPDLVNTHNLPGIGSGIWGASERRGIPVVHTVHDYHLLCPRVTLVQPDLTDCRPHPLLCGLRTRSMLRWAPAVSDLVAGTEYALGMHRPLFPHARQHIVPNPFDDSLRDVRPPGDPLRHVGYLGALHPNKGVLELLEAAAPLKAKGITLHLAGAGPLEAEVRARSRQGVVAYHGVLSGQDKAEFIERCDVGVVPSIWREPGGPPNSFLEWLSAGRPVLASRRGCLNEVIDTHGGSIAIEPTAASIIDTVSALAKGDRWGALVQQVGRVDTSNSEDRWLDRYAALFSAAA